MPERRPTRAWPCASSLEWPERALRPGRFVAAWCRSRRGFGNRSERRACGGRRLAAICYDPACLYGVMAALAGHIACSPVQRKFPMPTTKRRPWYSILYIQVLIAIALGIALGYFYPKAGIEMKPLGDGFISLIKMMIAPVIFCTVVHGISSMGDLKRIGRVGVKTLVYFEVVSTFALVIGLLVGEILQPGAGFNIDPASLDPSAVEGYVKRARSEERRVG